MRLEELITEGRTTPISADQTQLQTIASKCSDALSATKPGQGLYRGLPKFTDAIGYVNPTEHYSPARYAYSNIHYGIIELHPEWKNIPSRTSSIDCTTSFQEAENRGYPYFVLPINGAALAYGTSSDFWGNFPTINSLFNEDYGVGDFSMIGIKLIDKVIEAGRKMQAKGWLKDNQIETLEQLINYHDNIGAINYFTKSIISTQHQREQAETYFTMLEQIEQFISTVGKNSFYEFFTKIGSKKYNGLLSHLLQGQSFKQATLDLFNPEQIETVKTSNFGTITNLNKSIEVWTADPCYLVEYDTMEQLLDYKSS